MNPTLCCTRQMEIIRIIISGFMNQKCLSKTIAIILLTTTIMLYSYFNNYPDWYSMFHFSVRRIKIQPVNQTRYLYYRVREDGFNNQLISIYSGIYLANRTERTYVLPGMLQYSIPRNRVWKRIVRCVML